MLVIDATPLQTEHRYRGIGTYTAELLGALVALPGCPTLDLMVQPDHSSPSAVLKTLLGHPNVRTFTLDRPRWERSYLKWMARPLGMKAVLRRTQARLFHATDPDGIVLIPGIATIVTVYDLIPLHRAYTRLSTRQADLFLAYSRYLLLLKRADHIIAISEATKHDVMQHLAIPSERITVTPLAVDHRVFSPRSSTEIDSVTARYDLHHPYFLYVGSCDLHKNTDNILRGFESYCRSGNQDQLLCIAGKWPEDAIARVHAAYSDLISSGRVRLLGFVPSNDLPALYGGATAFVYPSLIEGFGLPVLEAMSCATAVITSNSSSLPEAGGNAALYVDPHNSEDIAGAFNRLATRSGERAEFVQRGLQQANSFSWARTAALTLEIYRRYL